MNSENQRDNTAAGLAPDLAARLSGKWQVRMQETDSRFVLSIPELGVVVSGTDIAAAYKELRQARERRLREFEAEGVLDWAPLPGVTPTATNESGLLLQLRTFLIKAAVVSLLFLGAVNIISTGLRETGYTLEKKLDKIADATPEDLERNRIKAGRIAQKLRPILQELRVAWEPAAPAADNATGEWKP